MVFIPLIIGIFGLLGASIFWPLLTWAHCYFDRRTRQNSIRLGSEFSTFPANVQILIPTHNEAAHIGLTLSSIQAAIQQFQSAALSDIPAFQVHVGLDGCTDETATLVREFPQVKVTEFVRKKGKWDTLKALISRAKGDWVILVDAGTLWPKNILIDFISQIKKEPHAVALAAAYRPQRAGWLSGNLWRIETFLKTIENLCGGPVSLHGATIAYRAAPLQRVMSQLGKRLWLNDDIVIPLYLRALYPLGKIVYPVSMVEDAGAKQGGLDLGRRKRMLRGNLQWATSLLPLCFRLNPIAGMLAMRRFFRIFWAYWIGFIILAIALVANSLVIPALITLGVLLAFSSSVRQMAGAAWVSLSAPITMMRSNWSFGTPWK